MTVAMPFSDEETRELRKKLSMEPANLTRLKNVELSPKGIRFDEGKSDILIPRKSLVEGRATWLDLGREEPWETEFDIVELCLSMDESFVFEGNPCIHQNKFDGEWAFMVSFQFEPADESESFLVSTVELQPDTPVEKAGVSMSWVRFLTLFRPWEPDFVKARRR